MPPPPATTSGSAPPTRGPGPRRRDLALLAVGLVLVLGLTLVLVGVPRHEDRPRVRAGDALLGVSSDQEPTGQTEVRLPWTVVQVAIGPAVEELPAPDDDGDADGSAERVAVRGPEDGSFVPVGLDLVPDRAVAFAVAAAPFTGRVELALRADGRDYPLTDAFEGILDADAQLLEPTAGEARWVAVDGVPQELELHLTVDGITQVVRADGSVDAGRAAALADVPTLTEVMESDEIGCADERRTDRSGLRRRFPSRLSCGVKVALRTPYVDGLGWAEEGRDYLVVQAAVNPRVISFARPGAGSELWREGSIDTTATLDGAAPLASADVNGLNNSPLAIADGDVPDQFVFDVSADGPVGDLVLGFDVPVELGEPFVTDRRTVSVRWTVPGEALA